MALEDVLKSDLKTAMKARDATRLATLRLLLSEHKNQVIAKGGPLTEADELAILTRAAKQRGEAIEAYAKAGRTELREEEEAQLAIIKGYLPDELSEAEVAAMVEEAIAATGAQSRREMGKVMGLLMPKVKGRFPGQRLRELIEAALGA